MVSQKAFQGQKSFLPLSFEAESLNNGILYETNFAKWTLNSPNFSDVPHFYSSGFSNYPINMNDLFFLFFAAYISLEIKTACRI